MHSIITAKLDDLKALCEKHRVKALCVFGSAARDNISLRDPAETESPFPQFEPIEFSD